MLVYMCVNSLMNLGCMNIYVDYVVIILNRCIYV